MPNIVRLYDFQPGNTIQSSQIDDEFNQLVSTINSLPDKNGVVQTNLNADLLDGFHIGVAGGEQTVPLCDADVIQVALNADLLDGQHAADIAAAAFDVGTKIPFYQALAPGGWSIVAAPTDHILGWKTGQAGGTIVANSWTLSGTTVNGTTLTESQIPSHWHDLQNHTHNLANHTHSDGSYVIDYDTTLVSSGSTPVVAHNTVGAPDESKSVSGTSGTPSTNTSGGPSVNFTGNKGGDGSHTHTLTQAGTWRPPIAYIIICSKD